MIYRQVKDSPMLLHSGKTILSITFEPVDNRALVIFKAAYTIDSSPQLTPEIIKGFFAFFNESATLAASF